MDLTKYNDLMRKLLAGDKSVLPELSRLQPEVLAWKQAQKAKAKQPEAQKQEELTAEPDKPKKKNPKRAKEE